MGLNLQFRWKPTPWGLDVADDGLTAFMDVDVFDGHLLLALAPMSIERFEKRGEGSGELACLI